MRSPLILGALAALLVGGCASGTAGSVEQPPLPVPTELSMPAEFQPGCDHPGTLVQVLSAPVTVRHAACDLTGVEVRYGLASVVVPDHGTAERRVETFAATTEPTHIMVTVDDVTRDVTITG